MKHLLLLFRTSLSRSVPITMYKPITAVQGGFVLFHTLPTPWLLRITIDFSSICTLALLGVDACETQCSHVLFATINRDPILLFSLEPKCNNGLNQNSAKFLPNAFASSFNFTVIRPLYFTSAMTHFDAPTVHAHAYTHQPHKTVPQNIPNHTQCHFQFVCHVSHNMQIFTDHTMTFSHGTWTPLTFTHTATCP